MRGVSRREEEEEASQHLHCSRPRGASWRSLSLSLLPARYSALCKDSREMAAAKTELLPALQISDPLSFPHSPMDSYPKLEEMIMLNSAGTPFLNASAPEGTGFSSGEPGEQYDHLAGGKGWNPLYSAAWVER